MTDRRDSHPAVGDVCCWCGAPRAGDPESVTVTQEQRFQDGSLAWKMVRHYCGCLLRRSSPSIRRQWIKQRGAIQGGRS